MGWMIYHSTQSVCPCKQDEQFLTQHTEASVCVNGMNDLLLDPLKPLSSVYVNGMNDLSLNPLKPLSVSVNGTTDSSLNPPKPVCVKWDEWFIAQPTEAFVCVSRMNDLLLNLQKPLSV